MRVRIEIDAVGPDSAAQVAALLRVTADLISAVPASPDDRWTYQPTDIVEDIDLSEVEAAQARLSSLAESQGVSVAALIDEARARLNPPTSVLPS